ncbi:MAG: DivIVA domain-containing protein [Nocardioides sp.]
MSAVVWLFAILVVLALGAIAVVASGRGTPMERAYDDRPDAVVPAEGPLSGNDLRRVRFSLAFRGYRMSEVDALLDRLAAEKESAEPDQPGDPPRPLGRGDDESH